ncbi:cytochrome P450 2C11-like [Sceloporus undulatus]|uniref:cytochrome P450 2C11-like n=1 Tax=Sceloporus undulatus TaxID=8520 RepID=UPI001C4D6AB6|nr:cytochrome P450 2C11-like [Sceloporus undulatus]
MKRGSNHIDKTMGQCSFLFSGCHLSGVIMSNGERWVQIRRFSLMTMRNFGMGKKSIEERIQEEAEYLVKELRDRKGLPFTPATLFSSATGNVISHILFGERFDYQGKDFVRILRLLRDGFRHESSIAGQLYNIIPGIMDYLPGAHQRLFEDTLAVKEFIAQQIKDHEKIFDPSNTPRDFIDAFLLKMEQEKTNPTTEFTKDNLIMTVLDLYFAGTETSSTTLRYICMLLLEHPAVEAKIHEEIDRVIGRERPPAMKDRPGMPYTEAVIHEAQRFLDLVPMGIFRMAKRDVQLEGFTVAKGSTIVVMLSSALHEGKQFKNPLRFDPEHFLDEKGDFKKNGADMPFSAGRGTAWEGLAGWELFLYSHICRASCHCAFLLVAEGQTQAWILPAKTGLVGAGGGSVSVAQRIHSRS